jgi:hypothetical protein
LRKALTFTTDPKRWLQLFLVDAAFLSLATLLIMGDINLMITILMNAESDVMPAIPMFPSIIALLATILFWYIIRMWIMGSIIHQSFRPKDIEKGYRISFKRLHKIIIATIILALISSIAGMIPIAGPVISIVFGWMFFFAFQGIILDNLGVVSTLKNSFQIFRKSPFDVFVSWFLIVIISTLIWALFSLPLIAGFFGLFYNALFATGTMQPDTLALLLMYAQQNIVSVFALVLVSILGGSISQVFSAKAQTEMYVQFKNRFPSILKSFARKVGKFL